MRCPKCQLDNLENANFCSGCGMQLQLACPKCGNVNPLTDKFCGGCGSPLAKTIEPERAKAATEAERKQVTVLFSDLSGYTAMTEKLDPEEVKEIRGHKFSAGSQAHFPVIRNLGFLVRNFPSARRRAERHLEQAIAAPEEIGARGLAEMAYLDLGLLCQASGKKGEPRDCLMKAKQLFEQCEAEAYLKQAKEALESLGGGSS
jgi:hypothetical protein